MDFRKPWGKINKDLKKGNYVLNIKNNYPVKSFDGEKYFSEYSFSALDRDNNSNDTRKLISLLNKTR